MRRRDLLRGAAAVGFGAACGAPPSPRVEGALLGSELMERGHRLRGPAPPFAAPTDRYDVVIVGLGVAGLSAAWALRRAGFSGTVGLFELGDGPGGTAAAHRGAPLGAHYVTMASPEARAYRVMLEDLGVIVGWRSGRPLYDPAVICPAPQERLYDQGTWGLGLWPQGRATPEDEAQLAAFSAYVDRCKATVGADGRRPFVIPVAASSDDPEWRALARTSFAAWLDGQGYSSPVLRWWLEYGCRDDYGTTLDETSAWAGLHYHAARTPDPADDRDLGTDLLTWPDGNNTLVRALAARSPWSAHYGAVVRAVDPGPPARLQVDVAGASRTITAHQVVLALPAHVIDHLLSRPARPVVLDHAPWRVAVVSLDDVPKSRGVSAAWDSVVYGASSLGFVSSAHVEGRFSGPTALSWYEPWPGAPGERRRALAAQTWEEGCDRVLTELSSVHPDVRRLVTRVDVMHWGHGTTRPLVGLHDGPTLGMAAAPIGAVHPAHTDLSGVSLFEEASYHGVRAAERVMSELGVGFEPLTG